MLNDKKEIVELDVYIDYCPTCTTSKDDPIYLKTYGEEYKEIMSSTVKMDWFMKCPRCEQLFDGGDLYVERNNGYKSRSSVEKSS